MHTVIFIWSIDRTISGATTPGQNGPGSNDNGEVCCIFQSSNITGISPSDCLVSYLLERRFYPSEEMQFVHSTGCKGVVNLSHLTWMLGFPSMHVRQPWPTWIKPSHQTTQTGPCSKKQGRSVTQFIRLIPLKKKKKKKSLTFYNYIKLVFFKCLKNQPSKFSHPLNLCLLGN